MSIIRIYARRHTAACIYDGRSLRVRAASRRRNMVDSRKESGEKKSEVSSFFDFRLNVNVSFFLSFFLSILKCRIFCPISPSR